MCRVSHGRCSRVMTRGLEMLVLEDPNVWSISCSGCESFAGVHYTGFVDGDCPLGCGYFFLWVPWGGWGWGSDKRHVTYIRVFFSLDDTCFQQAPFFMLYILLSSGGFTVSCFKTIGNGVPDPRFLGQTRTILKCRQPDHLFHVLKTMWGQCTSFRP